MPSMFATTPETGFTRVYIEISIVMELSVFHLSIHKIERHNGKNGGADAAAWYHD
jgi:hypothetical protein